MRIGPKPSQMRDNEVIDQLVSFNRPQVIRDEKKLDGAAADPTNAYCTNDTDVDKGWGGLTQQFNELINYYDVSRAGLS